MDRSGKQTPRKILVIVGSDSDLSQCGAGLEVLVGSEEKGVVQVLSVYTMSVHRNMTKLLSFLSDCHDRQDVDVIIAGAGWAAHLPGMIDAFLRYELSNTRIVVVGVALEDCDNESHTRAAELSISQVPGTQVVYRDAAGQFVGVDGFRRGCILAATGGLPVLHAPQPRQFRVRDIREVLATFCR